MIGEARYRPCEMAVNDVADNSARISQGSGGARRLIVFARYPVPGRTKTRLIPAVGALRAARLQRAMTAQALAAAREARRLTGAHIEVRHAGGSREAMRRWLGRDVTYLPQGEGDLGRRMLRAFEEAFADGCRKVVIVGADCPDLGAEHLCQAFDMLDAGDLALGPSADGGYWLIALGKRADLFTGVTWSTETVLSQTLERARAAGLNAHTLSMLADIDRPADLAHLPPRMRPVVDRPYVSVVVPALNEIDNIAATVASARDDDAEVIVVDGGSIDSTPHAARRAGARVIVTGPGRGGQMNAGAEIATGEVLLFLHGDTALPPRYVDHVFEALADAGAAGGAFLFTTDADTPAARATETLINLRTQHLLMPYGDQAIFLPADLFDAIGGFEDLPIMEDVRLVQRIKAQGRLKIVPAAVHTSGRRWKTHGVVKPTVINALVTLGHAIGVPLPLLARLYGVRPVPDAPPSLPGQKAPRHRKRIESPPER